MILFLPALFLSVVFANASVTKLLASSEEVVPCSGNSAANRAVWCEYDINTDFYTEVPETGVTREYWLELVNTTAAPDGVPRNVLTVNGTVPGPTLYADWGDYVKIHVYNGLQNNGTSIHFHGIRQNYTNPQDGTNSITQCPTAPGETTTYEWRATQYGTTYYHSHFALQAWDGVFGGIVINGPASSNYDQDAGMLFLGDWTHETFTTLYHSAERGGPPTLKTGLINGTNVWEEDDGDIVGSRFKMAVTAGNSYRLRLVNGAMSTHFKFSIDNHVLTVISTDLVPIKPYNTTSLSIGIGQRYDVIITADQDSVASDFWTRAIPQLACSEIDNVDNIKGILHYGNSTDDATTPTTTAYSYTDSCLDEPANSLVPVVEIDVSSPSYNSSEPASVQKNSDNLFKWFMGPTSFKAEWDNPTLLQIYNGNTSWSNSSHVIEVNGVNEWVFVDIEMSINVSHPIHFHGHDFVVLASGSGAYSNNITLNLKNPPRRDTAMLPALGYVVLGFQTNNPGAWLMHCHIGWHQSEGFAMQFVERLSEIKPMIDIDAIESTCAGWERYAAAKDIVDDDSGI